MVQPRDDIFNHRTLSITGPIIPTISPSLVQKITVEYLLTKPLINLIVSITEPSGQHTLTGYLGRVALHPYPQGISTILTGVSLGKGPDEGSHFGLLLGRRVVSPVGCHGVQVVPCVST